MTSGTWSDCDDDMLPTICYSDGNAGERAADDDDDDDDDNVDDVAARHDARNGDDATMTLTMTTVKVW